MLNQLNELKYNYVTPGLLEREQYTELLSMSDVYCSTTIEDAGPRTTYEAGAAATPIISFDNCNSIDFVNKNNGALIKTYDVKGYALAIAKMINLTEQEKFNYSHEIYKSYKDLMNTERITNLWKDFFNQTLGENNETQSI
jgi:glycosyltransferase involved in cell wall biosynthesis